jgi:hypothetical protein
MAAELRQPPAELERDKLIEFLMTFSQRLTEVAKWSWSGNEMSAPRVYVARKVNALQHDVAGHVLRAVGDADRPSLDDIAGAIRELAADFPELDSDLAAAWNESLEGI